MAVSRMTSLRCLKPECIECKLRLKNTKDMLSAGGRASRLPVAWLFHSNAIFSMHFLSVSTVSAEGKCQEITTSMEFFHGEKLHHCALYEKENYDFMKNAKFDFFCQNYSYKKRLFQKSVSFRF